ncbi:hypothetical protein ACLMJK_008415 [Lecanora helva]
MASKPPAGHFRLLYFASAASFTARSSEDFPAPLSVAELFSVVEERHPGITSAVLSTAAVTVNLEYVDAGESPEEPDEAKRVLIKDGDEVAIVPPVSSG